MQSRLFQNTLLVCSLIGIFLIGVLIRIHNLTPYKIYPDSYQSLITAKNITSYHSVVGFLGKEGMMYPDFFGWTRPGYPLVILLITLFTRNLSQAAQLIALVSGIAALPLAYLLGKQVFRSSIVGVAMMFLLAISFNHIVWGGFILTEPLAIFLILFFLLVLFSRERIPEKYILLFDSLCGVLFGFLVLTRYEYILLVIPIGYFILKSKKYKPTNMYWMVGTFLFLMLLTGVILYPLPGSFLVLYAQAKDILLPTLAFGIITGFASLFFTKLEEKKQVWIKDKLSIAIIIGLWVGATYLLLQIFFPSIFTFGFHHLSALRNFLIDDFLLLGLFIIGVALLLESKYTNLVTFLLLTLGILFAAYHHTNPTMERYMTHLIPFLLLPAGYGVGKIITFAKKKSVVLFIFSGILCMELV